MGWTSASGPNRRALIWKTKPRIMLATPSSQTGRRARRRTSQTSKPAVSWLLAPKRWQTDAVAVQKLAAVASRTAFSISRLLTPGTGSGTLRRVLRIRYGGSLRFANGS